MTCYLLNAPILTDYGRWSFTGPMDLQAAQDFLRRQNCVSAIGHAATAQYLTELLGLEISVARRAITMSAGDVAIVFWLRERLSEGAVLGIDDLRQHGGDFGLLERLE